MRQLVIGNKNYSSFSMRAWMLLRFAELAFEEIGIGLYEPSSRKQVQDLGGETGLVPVLLVDGQAIWDTLAIVEYVYEHCRKVWPSDQLERARARAYSGEVHSGLNALRAAMPCNTRARSRIADRTTEVEADIAATATVSKVMANAPRRIASMKVTIRIPGSYDGTQRSKLEAAAHSCPVHNVLGIEAPITIDWIG